MGVAGLQDSLRGRGWGDLTPHLRGLDTPRPDPTLAPGGLPMAPQKQEEARPGDAPVTPSFRELQEERLKASYLQPNDGRVGTSQKENR